MNDVWFNPGWLMLLLSGGAGLFFLIKSRSGSTTQPRRHKNRPPARPTT